ncbi:MAG: hypothetical protein A2W05_06670 [Candidatus Schekmanbacteria bacterium RBG_16_38_10]|uniref:Phosphate acyltransferase n=1 Tax=Candidatus Schekmanbacteria bacterium RBG_16_38_10 TaxID=1817879 RepID=A0A1F7RSV9_9BACT|nr:MAG: hypothetical protein A2W05_06670 [Candidatus Schekmanbacteria bacterium RBG_16_38_10]
MIAVDAMGGDFAPGAIVKGAISAAKEFGTKVVLVGDKSKILRHFSSNDGSVPSIEIRHAPQVIEMGEIPSEGFRKKPNSSLLLSLRMLQNNQVKAVVSAGNTGALMYSAIKILGAIPKIYRPAISTILPGINGKTIVLDVGANVDCRPEWLVQFAIMGHVYAKTILEKERPKIALLTNGTEPAKGNQLTHDVYKMLENSSLNFIGNIEGNSVFYGDADVVVCDGFVGNIFLKLTEGFSKVYIDMLKEEVSKRARSGIGAYLMKPAFESLNRRLDFTEYGGAPLLGVNGVCIVAHGSSTSHAIKNAIMVAENFVNKNFNATLSEETKRLEGLVRYKSPKRRWFWRSDKDSSGKELDEDETKK